MTKGKKVGGLVMLLAIPILILVFLEKFGQQHYTIPTDPSAAEGLSALVPAGALGKAFQLPDQLIDNQGNNVSSDLLLDQNTVWYMLPPVFSDTAQLVLERLVGVRDIFEGTPEVQLVVVVATDQTDSLSVLAQRYRSRGKNWQFLANTTQGREHYSIFPPGTSSATVLLIDQKQRVRGYYDGMQEKEIDRLVVETRILLYGVE